jgi:hypothetical protein
MSQQPSGIDLARAALAAARADAKTRPAQPQRKKSRGAARPSARRAGDPMGLGAAINRMMTERGWQPPEQNGSILDQWPDIAPELAGKVAAVRYEHDTGTLHLRPASNAYATQLRLFQAQVLAKVQQAPSGASVRALKILPVGAAPQPAPPADAPTQTPTEQAPTPIPRPQPPGYRQARALLLENKLSTPEAMPYEEEARQRQIAALRANRLPETEHREAQWAQAAARTGPEPGSVEASLAAARAHKRREQAGLMQPRRASDVA